MPSPVEIVADGKTSSSINPFPIGFGNGAATDAFGRVRVSQVVALFDNKNVHSNNDGVWQERTSGASSSITHLPNESSIQLQCGTGATDYAIRQTSRYISYAPGKSHLVFMTFVLGATKANVVNEVGYGDASDGVFLERTSTQTRIFIRSSTSGSVVETNSAIQSAWNLDTLDGNGNSGLTLDLTKAQILVIDLQWLGVGRVRVGFDIGGALIYVHEFNHANSTSSVYMKTPSLPVRFKIYNTAISASATTMKEICSSVSTEGGLLPVGIESSEGNLITARVAVTTRRPIFAIRLKSAFSGTVATNRRTVKLIDASFSSATNNAVFEICHIHDPSAITATWVDYGTAVEYSRDISSVTSTMIHVINHLFVGAGIGQQSTSLGIEANTLNEHAFLSQNYESDNSQLFVIYATAETGTANCWAHITWLEFE